MIGVAADPGGTDRLDSEEIPVRRPITFNQSRTGMSSQ
jgi:hypothetical protein